MNTLRTFVRTVLLGSGLAAPALHAQTPDITRHDLQQRALSAAGREVVQVLVRFAPGATAANHHHPGEEIVFVTEGTLEYRLEGLPPATLEAGKVLFIPHGVNHEVRNIGNGGAAELATYIVEIGRPLVVPAK